MQEHPHYQNVVREVFGFLQNRRDELIAAGIDPHRICIDPGIGFGKTPQHNIDTPEKLLAIARAAMPGARRTSRKSFLSHIQSGASSDPAAATIGVSCALALQGVQILRVHDVAAVRQALAGFDTVQFDSSAPRVSAVANSGRATGQAVRR